MKMATNASVQVNWQSGDPQPGVQPERATISTGGQVTWSITLPASFTLEINFDVKQGVKGPFPTNGQPDNPSQGVYEGGTSTIVTAPATAADGTDWKYNVIVYDASHQPVSSVDPKVSIRN